MSSDSVQNSVEELLKRTITDTFGQTTNKVATQKQPNVKEGFFKHLECPRNDNNDLQKEIESTEQSTVNFDKNRESIVISDVEENLEFHANYGSSEEQITKNMSRTNRTFSQSAQDNTQHGKEDIHTFEGNSNSSVSFERNTFHIKNFAPEVKENLEVFHSDNSECSGEVEIQNDKPGAISNFTVKSKYDTGYVFGERKHQAFVSR